MPPTDGALDLRFKTFSKHFKRSNILKAQKTAVELFALPDSNMVNRSPGETGMRGHCLPPGRWELAAVMTVLATPSPPRTRRVSADYPRDTRGGRGHVTKLRSPPLHRGSPPSYLRICRMLLMWRRRRRVETRARSARLDMEGGRKGGGGRRVRNWGIPLLQLGADPLRVCTCKSRRRVSHKEVMTSDRETGARN